MQLPLKLSKDDGIHWNLNKAMSYDPHLILVMAGRGIGKTTGGAIAGLSAVEKGGKFIFGRRYATEQREIADKDVFGKILDGVEYKNHDDVFTYKYGDMVLGWGVPLSKYRSVKSITKLEEVSIIILDEMFVRPSGTYHYLKNEVECALELLSTVERTRPGNSVRMVILGNNEDLFNPYMEYWKVPPFDFNYYDKERGLYVEKPKHSEALLELEKQTGLYKLTQGTSYFNYHYENAVMGSQEIEIIQKPAQSKLFCRFVMNENTLNVYTWYLPNGKSRLFVEHKPKIIMDNTTYILMQDGKWNYYYIKLYISRMKNWFSSYHYNSNIDYGDQKAADMTTWIMEEI